MKPKQLLICIFMTSVMLPALLQADAMGEGGEEVWISALNTVQLGNSPEHPHATVNYLGQEIHVWQDSTYNPTLQARNIVMRVFDVDGSTLVNPVQINTNDINSQSYPRVAVSADNTFLVVWESLENDPLRVMIRSQAFTANGQPSGLEQVVNNILTGKSGGVYLDVAALVGGGYVVVWQSGAAGDDTGNNIQGRRIGTNGVPLASQFPVSTISGDFEGHSTVAALDDGGFVAAWAYTDVWSRRFNNAGAPQTDRIQVNTTTSGNEINVSMTRHSDGRIAIVWRDGGDSVDPVTAGVRGRIYSSTLSALGNDFQINSLTEGDQSHPSVADYGANGFFVVWQSATTVGNDIEPHSIQGRIVTANNQFGTAQFQVNQWTAKSQAAPEVGGNNGLVASAWTSLGTQDFGNLPVIKGRSWNICGIFCDGFE